MVKIEYELVSGKFSMTVKGHSNYAPHGNDIVCAAISTIATMAVLGYERLAETYPDLIEVKEIKEPTVTITQKQFDGLIANQKELLKLKGGN